MKDDRFRWRATETQWLSYGREGTPGRRVIRAVEGRIRLKGANEGVHTSSTSVGITPLCSVDDTVRKEGTGRFPPDVVGADVPDDRVTERPVGSLGPRGVETLDLERESYPLVSLRSDPSIWGFRGLVGGTTPLWESVNDNPEKST